MTGSKQGTVKQHRHLSHHGDERGGGASVGIKRGLQIANDYVYDVRKYKLRWHVHIKRSTGVAMIILEGTVQGVRRKGRQKNRWEDSSTEWACLKLEKALRKAENRRLEKSGCPIILGASTII